MNDEVVNHLPFPSTTSRDMTLPKRRMKEIDELISSQGLDTHQFSWTEDISSKFQRPDVLVSKLVHTSGFYFLFNSDRKGVMSFTRSPGTNSKVEQGETGDWPHQVNAAREWLMGLKEESDLKLRLDDAMSTSERDELLDIYRRGAFDRNLQELAKQALEFGDPLALVMIDIDKFKLINDGYGHPAGDEVLQFVASTIKGITGSKGKPYRYGGEELAVLLPNYSGEEAAALAERIRIEIELGSVGAKAIRVTASFGVAELPKHATTAPGLVEMADAAMYDAKNLGRNLVRISGEPAPERKTGFRVSRREANDTGFTDQEAESIRLNYFRSGFVRCPRDESILEIDQFQSDEAVTPELNVSCPFCGLSARIQGAM